MKFLFEKNRILVTFLRARGFHRTIDVQGKESKEKKLGKNNKK